MDTIWESLETYETKGVITSVKEMGLDDYLPHPELENYKELVNSGKYRGRRFIELVTIETKDNIKIIKDFKVHILDE